MPNISPTGDYRDYPRFKWQSSMPETCAQMLALQADMGDAVLDEEDPDDFWIGGNGGPDD